MNSRLLRHGSAAQFPLLRQRGSSTRSHSQSQHLSSSGAPSPRAPPPPHAWPEHVVVRMPMLSPSFEHAELLTWHVAEGGCVNMTDLLYDVATSTLTEEANAKRQQRRVLEVEAHEEGWLARTLVQPGDEAAAALRPGDPMAVFVENKSDVAAFASYGTADAALASDAGDGGASSDFMYQAYTKKTVD